MPSMLQFLQKELNSLILLICKYYYYFNTKNHLFSLKKKKQICSKLFLFVLANFCSVNYISTVVFESRHV